MEWDDFGLGLCVMGLFFCFLLPLIELDYRNHASETFCTKICEYEGMNYEDHSYDRGDYICHCKGELEKIPVKDVLVGAK